MKKFLMLIFSLLLVAVTGCSSLVMEDPANYISTTEALEKLDNKDTFALFLCETKQDVCKDMWPELDKLKKNDDIIFDYIDLGEIDTEKEYEEIDKIASEEYLDVDLEFMPKIIYIVDGKRNYITEGTNVYELMLEDYKEKLKK